MSGQDAAVAKWFSQQPVVQDMVSDLHGLLARWLPEYRKQDRAYVTIAIGCTGGQHRSVYIVERLAALLRDSYDQLTVRHRELWDATQRRKPVETST